MAAFTSAFSAYLGTNYVPDDRDRHHILEILEKPASESKKLEEQISSIDDALKALLQQRQNLQAVIDQHERMISSFRVLTDNILRKIFLYCLPSDHNPIMSIHEPPFVLALVCKKWKSVVYQAPQLWASIHVPLPTYPIPDGDIPEADFQHTLSTFRERVEAHRGAIHNWLSRSGTCPLSISFHPSVSYPIQEKTHLTPYFETLLSFSSRWHTIELTILTGQFSSFFAAIPASAVPMLHSLNITFAQHWQDWGGHPHSPLWNNSGFLNAPRLRKLEFYHYPLPMSTLQVNWSDLTWLDIPDPRVPWQDRGLNLKETHALLMHCPMLRHLSIDIDDLTDFEPGDFSPVCHRHLQFLDILDNAPYFGNLIKILYFTQLYTIRFHSLLKPSSNRRSTLATLLTRMDPAKIESLSTNLQMLTCEDFIDIAQRTPNLMTFCNEAARRGPSDEQGLWLRSILDFPVDMVSAAYGLLTPDADANSADVLWPCLTHIDLGKIRRWTDAAVLKFIKARMEREEEGIAKLESVKANFYRDMMEDIRPALGRYIDDGLGVVLNYPSSRVAIPGSIRPRKALFKRNPMFRP